MRKKTHSDRSTATFNTVLIIFFLVLFAQTVAIYVFSGKNICLFISLGAILICAGVVFFCKNRLSSYFYKFYMGTVEKLKTPNSDLFSNFTMPVLMLCDDKIVWYNKRFRTEVLKGDDILGDLPEDIFPEAARSSLTLSDRADISFLGRSYTVYRSEYETAGERYDAFYFADITDLKKIADEFDSSRPVVMIMSIDSFDELTGNLAESERASVRGQIEREIESFASKIDGFMKKLNNHTYLFMLNERGFSVIKAEKFSVLDNVRNLKVHGDKNATLSIGVGRGDKTLKDCEISARQALEMAQGRGGDQAAVKKLNNFEFFGGISSKGVERRTKVKTRVIAAALKELIRGSDSVFIVGHKYGDLDSLGASLGLYKAVETMGINGYIVLTREQHLAKQMIAGIDTKYDKGVIISGDRAMELITKKSLVIVVDTHRKDFIDAPDLFSVCSTKVVIDHHRKNVDFIDDAVIFYHEPYASSACEMVCELLQYMGDDIIEKPEAEALFAGIMLDTRNFVLRTGVRTFEASAYLRARDADPVQVKKLFADSMDVYKERSKIVASAKRFGRCAVSVDDAESGSRVAASQAADELLNIENVDASFVIYKSSDTINISARSLGALNVQIIMEELGGGGHHTMSAAQLRDCDVQTAEKMLFDAILKHENKEKRSNYEGSTN